MVLLAAGNACARYLGRALGANLSSNVYLELQWYLFSLVFLLGGAWALEAKSHVRVDVFFARFSRRTQAWIDLLGTLFFLLPFSLFLLWVSWPTVLRSWRIAEGSPDPGGLPRYPIKTFLLVCFSLLALQGLAELIKAVATLRTGPPASHDEPPPEPAGHL